MLPCVVFVQPLLICQDPRIARAYTARNTKIYALLACLAQPTYPIPARYGTDTAGRGAFEPPAEDVFIRSSPADVKKIKQTLQPCRRQKQNKRSRVSHRKIPNSNNYRLEIKPIL